jgi:glycerophosphoryl diester phosphodiesterase
MTLPALLLRAFAHRGLHDASVAENSMASAPPLMLATIELDIQPSRDRYPMVFTTTILGG